MDMESIKEKVKDYFDGDDLARSVWESKYKYQGEETPDDMHIRLAKEFARIEEKYVLEERRNITIDDIKNLSSYGSSTLMLNEEEIPDNKIRTLLGAYYYGLFKGFKYIVPQGSIMSQLGSPSIGSLSNCFVVDSPVDSYGGIFKSDQEIVQIAKRRGGVGIDISTLRPNGTTVTNAAKTSTGVTSFMERFSNTIREVGQGGRRGALMISIDINHPDVLEFIRIKRDLTKVTGANISIKLNNEFMKAVENNEDYILRFPCDFNALNNHSEFINEIPYETLVDVEDKDVFVRKIKAKEYWNEIIKSAHNVAEPGIMFGDNHINNSPDGVYTQYRGITTNPCGEIFMQPYDACRLIAVNLFSFVENPFTKTAKFDYNLFYRINYEAMRLSDSLIDLELEHIDKIIQKIENDPESADIKSVELELWKKIKDTAQKSRRTGLGFTALGDTLVALNLKYDSEEALKVIEQIMHKKLESELDCTVDLAILRGKFDGNNPAIESNNFYDFIHSVFPQQSLRMFTHGRRNSSWSTVAPTGTVSILTQTTSGIEPLFKPYYLRRKKINPNNLDSRIDFVDQNGDKWQEYPVLHPKFKKWLSKSVTEDELENRCSSKEYLDIAFKESPWYKSTAESIDWTKRVEIQSIIQKYITHSISSTINLPENVSEEEVSNIYMEAWKKGLKGITVYREDSRSGVLVSKKEKSDEFKERNAPKRPKKLNCDLHYTKVKGVEFCVLVGLYENKPYEVFIYNYGEIKPSIDKQYYIEKIKKGNYILSTDEVEPYNFGLITENLTDEQATITRLISTCLRHGASILFVVEQLNKVNGDITSFSKAIGRVLKKYITDTQIKDRITCSECGSSNMLFEEGCLKCTDCGNSKCG